MAHYILPEMAEHDLYEIRQALALVEHLAALAGDETLEVHGKELSAFLGLIRSRVEQVQEAAQFSAR